MQASSEVLARKYRPKNFDELVGQEGVAQTLSLSLNSSRLAHAYLFSGLRGSGKTSTARIFAKALICEAGVSAKPCEECSNCILLAGGSHIDVIEMDAASNRGIDDVRDLIEQTKYRPATARFKIFIIDEVHMLTTQAFNALLKTLEEPPEFVKFILATTDPLKLPVTILSRVQHFRFKSISQDKVINHLAFILDKEQIGFERDALSILARSGGGSLRDTLTMLDQAIIYSKGFVDVASVTDMLALVDPSSIMSIFEAIFARDIDALKLKLVELREYEASMVIDEMIVFLKERLFANDASFSLLLIDRYLRILNDAKSLLGMSSDGEFVLLLAFLKMIEAQKIKDLDEMIASLSSGEQKVAPKMVAQSSRDETPKQVVEQDRFTTLQERIADRNYALGECFSKNIRFISFADGVLQWESCAEGECREALRHGYGAIRHLVYEIYGEGVSIENKPCSKLAKQKPQELPTQEQASEIEANDTSGSMVEDVETLASSCVESCNGMPPSKEVDGAAILDEAMVQKTIELFGAKKVTIQSKI